MGNLYRVTYKQYKDDDGVFIVMVCAKDEKTANSKVMHSGLICFTDRYTDNSGYIVNIESLNIPVIM